MVGQPKVVVRAEVEHFLAVHHQPGALRRADGADAVVQALRFQAFKFLVVIQSVLDMVSPQEMFRAIIAKTLQTLVPRMSKLITQLPAFSFWK